MQVCSFWGVSCSITCVAQDWSSQQSIAFPLTILKIIDYESVLDTQFNSHSHVSGICRCPLVGNLTWCVQTGVPLILYCKHDYKEAVGCD